MRARVAWAAAHAAEAFALFDKDGSGALSVAEVYDALDLLCPTPTLPLPYPCPYPYPSASVRRSLEPRSAFSIWLNEITPAMRLATRT